MNPITDYKVVPLMMEYLAERLDAAEEYIKKCPCDPDVTTEQLQAYQKWQELKKREPQLVIGNVRLD
jgi:hypothetical protein